MPRAKSSEELRIEFLKSIKKSIRSWERTEKNSLQKLNGLAFSILSLLDGASMNFPKIEMVLKAHPEDIEFHTKNNRNWIQPDTILNSDFDLHNLWSDVTVDDF